MNTTVTAAVSLNDGRAMPQLGLGVWRASNEEAQAAIAVALQAGYRAIDTAPLYQNEKGVGLALAESGLPRNGFFVTTKVSNADHGRAATHAALQRSLDELALDHVDLYLIHWPLPAQDLYVESWRALIELREAGKTKSIGVSNFTVTQLQRVIDETGVVPALNQIELHPFFQQNELREFHARHGIATECWAPLARGLIAENVTIRNIAAKHGRSNAQIILRWHIQNGLIAIPKSVQAQRIRANIDVFGFSLDEDDLAAIADLNAGKRLGADPETFTG